MGIVSANIGPLWEWRIPTDIKVDLNKFETLQLDLRLNFAIILPCDLIGTICGQAEGVAR